MNKLWLLFTEIFLGVLLSASAMAEKTVTIEAVRIGKIVYKLNTPSNADIKLANLSTSSQKIEAECTVISGVDSGRVVSKQQISFAPSEKKLLKISWNSGENDGGYELKVDIWQNHKLIDSRREYGAVTDFSVSVGQYGVANPGWFNKPGQEKGYIEQLRNNYFSAFEYYCWTSCPMTGLTPPTEEWMPHTESQVNYEATISKKFIKSFVAEAHQNGIAVFPWMNGEVSLSTGLDHPEYFRYGKNGQPLLYNGNIINGKRYAIAYTSALYNENNAYRWGKEMAKSVDMFGWDGCRFDWYFIPALVGDPMRTKKSDWFNFVGQSARELYPEQDTEGARFLQAFRRGVAETWPEFIYGTNAGEQMDEKSAALPKYHKESSTNSWMWFEYLLNYHDYSWEKWSTKIVHDSSLAKVNGCQVGIGWMTPPERGTVTARLLPYLFVYSGVHWIGPMDRESGGDNWKIWRYAMRYSAYFYNNNFKPMLENNYIFIAGGERLFWKPWAFEKKTKFGRELLVNMINLPKGESIRGNHQIPEPQKNLILTFNKNSNEKIKRVVMLNAEPEPNFAVLESKVENDKVTVKIPQVVWGASVLIETTN